MTITDASGPHTFNVMDGQDGAPGTDGKDGKDGSDGAPGRDGQPGADGYSPSASVTKSGKTATISITDKNGTTTATVSDGQDGQDGQDGSDGYTPVKGTDYWTAQDKAEMENDILQSQTITDIQSDITSLNGDLTELDTDKADKVSGAVSGNFAGLDANGNLTDSGKKPSDFLETAPVTDVQVNGTSVLNQGVANIPLATDTKPGVAIMNSTYGIRTQNGYATIQYASNDNIKAGVSDYRPIVPTKQDRSVFYGLAKAAGDSTQSASSNAVGTYTSEAKAAIKSMLGVNDVATDVTVSGATPTITALANTRYVCGEVTSISFTPCASGICDVQFTSGSTVAVLTLPNTVKMPDWFDASSLETNTVYEIMITDGVWGCVMSWQA